MRQLQARLALESVQIHVLVRVFDLQHLQVLQLGQAGAEGFQIGDTVQHQMKDVAAERQARKPFRFLDTHLHTNWSHARKLSRLIWLLQ